MPVMPRDGSATLGHDRRQRGETGHATIDGDRDAQAGQRMDDRLGDDARRPGHSGLRARLAFNPSRRRLEAELRSFAARVPAGTLVLDAGCGDAPYAPLFAHCRYESADFVQVENRRYVRPTYVCDLAAIPVEDGRFGAVVFSQVMEHLPRPAVVLRELHRVLREGGILFYSGPLYFAEHEQPYDFYRYTQFGVRYLFEEAGFSVERLDWMEGYFATLHYQLRLAAVTVPLAPAAYGGGLVGLAAVPFAAACRLMFAASGLAFGWLDGRSKHTAGGHPKNYVAIVRK